MQEEGGGLGLPQMTEIELMQRLLSEDKERSQDEPAIAASIGEQMLHMDLMPLPRSMRARIRDVCSRVKAKNAILVGGGIGHLTAWLFDLWCGSLEEDVVSSGNKPETLRIIEPGTRFGVIIDRLIRRYAAESWAVVIAKPWQEVSAESASGMAAGIALSESVQQTILPMPPDLVIIDLPEEERATAASTAFDLISPGGMVLVQEPTVPTGDVGAPEEGKVPTQAQSKVKSFNDWIEVVKRVDKYHSLGFVELTGGTLVALLRTNSE